MKLSRNDPCSCGSGKKYKRCCMDSIAKQHAAFVDDIAQTLMMNPNLSLDELNLVAQRKVEQRNHQPHADFCGLTSAQMQNWLYAPLHELIDVTIKTPSDLSSSPVMRYLALILDEAMLQGGSFKATTKGNLPAKLVKQASELLPGFAVAKFETVPSISEYMGSNEDKFNALHYTRILAELAGIIYRKSGAFYVKQSAQKQYAEQGLQAFFVPMLSAAIKQYNWAYLDSWSDKVDLRMFWVFMLWRLQSHGSVNRLSQEVAIAFPTLIDQLPVGEYFSPEQLLNSLIRTRFIERFLQFWGFVTVDPKGAFYREDSSIKAVDIQPLFKESFIFTM